MNIKEHIEAGRYPTDNKGRPLVPHRDGGTVTVLSTDYMGSNIAGYVINGGRAGELTFWPPYDRTYLLPPPPRKVTEVRWAAFNRRGRWVNSASSRTALRSDEGNDVFLTEVTCTYELPWDCESPQA